MPPTVRESPDRPAPSPVRQSLVRTSSGSPANGVSVMVSVVRGPNPVPSPASIRTGPQFQTTSAAGKRSRETQPELALLAKHVPRQQLLQQIRSASTRTLTFSVQLSSEFACVICTAGFAASLVPGHSSHVPMYHLLYVPLLCCVV